MNILPQAKQYAKAYFAQQATMAINREINSC
jgi:hypothetical protein